MTGDPSHGVSIVIVNLPTEDLFSPRAVFRGGNLFQIWLKAARMQLSEIHKEGGFESQRLEDPLLAKAVEGPSADLLNNFAEDYESKITV